MNGLQHVETVEFAGAELECVHDDDQGEVYVSVKRACDGLGIDYSSQLSKLKNTHWACVVLIATHDSTGRHQEMSMIDLDTLAMWLATIQVNRVSEDARSKVIEFQKKCVRVLRQHFFEAAPAVQEVTAATEPPLLERETRHPDGRVVVERFAPPAEYERPALLDIDPPEPDLTPDVPVELLRKRFHGAFGTALNKLPEFKRIHCRTRRGEFCRKMNSELKRFIGRSRDDWNALDYHNAVYWLRMQYAVDIQWILKPQAPTHH